MGSVRAVQLRPRRCRPEQRSHQMRGQRRPSVERAGHIGVVSLRTKEHGASHRQTTPHTRETRTSLTDRRRRGRPRPTSPPPRGPCPRPERAEPRVAVQDRRRSAPVVLVSRHPRRHDRIVTHRRRCCGAAANLGRRVDAPTSALRGPGGPRLAGRERKSKLFVVKTSILFFLCKDFYGRRPKPATGNN